MGTLSTFYLLVAKYRQIHTHAPTHTTGGLFFQFKLHNDNKCYSWKKYLKLKANSAPVDVQHSSYLSCQLLDFYHEILHFWVLVYKFVKFYKNSHTNTFLDQSTFLIEIKRQFTFISFFFMYLIENL